jgi:hypothetical protein
MNGLHCASLGHSAPQNESVPKTDGETVDKQVLSDGRLCVSAGYISELGKKMPLSHRVVRRKVKVISVKVPMVKSGTSKNKGSQTRCIHEPLGRNDASDKVSPLRYVLYLDDWLLQHFFFIFMRVLFIMVSTQINNGLSNTKIHTHETCKCFLCQAHIHI